MCLGMAAVYVMSFAIVRAHAAQEQASNPNGWQLPPTANDEKNPFAGDVKAVAKAGAIPVALPLKKPLMSAAGTRREIRCLLVRIEAANGAVGWGEAGHSSWGEDAEAPGSGGEGDSAVGGGRDGAFRALRGDEGDDLPGADGSPAREVLDGPGALW